MKLYLSSYKIGNSKEVLKDWLTNHDKNIIVIPNALDGYQDGERKRKSIEEKCKELEELGFKIKIFDLRDYFKKASRLRRDLQGFRAFYVLGGNVFVLRQAMKLSGFDLYLKEISKEKDYLYAGFSAGVCVLANNLHGLELVDDKEANPYNYNETIWEGIGLIDFMIVPHYDSKEHQESPLMYEVVSYYKKNNLNYKTLRDGEVIVIDI